jgi:hypothetical protein
MRTIRGLVVHDPSTFVCVSRSRDPFFVFYVPSLFANGGDF